MSSSRFHAFAIPSGLSVGAKWLGRSLEYVAFWSAIALSVVYPAILLSPDSVTSTQVALLIGIHAACLVLGHGYD